MLQIVIVAVVVAAVALWLGRRWWRQLKAPAPSCGCGCSGCGQGPGPEPRPITDLMNKEKPCACKDKS